MLRWRQDRESWVFECERADNHVATSAGMDAHYKGSRAGRSTFLFWETRNPRVALKMIKYCADGQERNRIRELAKGSTWPDPDRVTITFDGEEFRWWAPVKDGFNYKQCPQATGWYFVRNDGRGLSFWGTRDLDDAMLCYELALKAHRNLIIERGALAVIEERIAYYRGWQNVPKPPEEDDQ